jgi:hypothetical protein
VSQWSGWRGVVGPWRTAPGQRGGRRGRTGPWPARRRGINGFVGRERLEAGGTITPGTCSPSTRST